MTMDAMQDNVWYIFVWHAVHFGKEIIIDVYIQANEYRYDYMYTI